MADKNTNHQNREIFELKLINSLLLKEFSKSNSEIHSSYSNIATVEITQLKKLNSIFVKELAESRDKIDKLKQENEILKSEQDSKNASKNVQSFDNQKNRKRKYKCNIEIYSFISSNCCEIQSCHTAMTYSDENNV